MPARALAWLLLVLVPLVAAPAGSASADAPAPPPTDNAFVPDDRDLSECISALPKPGCGSEARGGWMQAVLLLTLLLGLAFIAWRVVRAARRGRSPGDGGPAGDDVPDARHDVVP